MATILQIDITVNRGSHGKIVEQIGESIISQGWDSYVAFGRHKVTSKSKVIHIGNKWSQFFHLISTRIFDNHGLCSYFATRSLIKKIDKIKPDIIHLHNIHGYYLNYKALFIYLAKIDKPIVWTLHDCWAFTGHCAHFISINCDKWKTLCYDCPLKRSYPASVLFDRSKHNYINKKQLFLSVKNITVVTVSKWLGQMAQNSFLGKYPVHVIHSGIDLDVFQPREWEGGYSLINRIMPFINNKHCILSVSSKWGESKGLSDFLKLSEIISDEFVIVLVGELNESVVSLPKNVVHIKKTLDQIELSYLYSLASVVLSMSQAETMGLTMVEAMACGTPVIVYDNTALPELVTPDVGYVVADGDVNAAYSKICQICSVPKSFYMESCRKRAVRCYSKKECFNNYITIYNELMQKKR